MRLWRKRKVDPNEWDFGQYRGYDLRRGMGTTHDMVFAYGGVFPSTPWFEGATPDDVKEEIDKALAAVPPPVY